MQDTYAEAKENSEREGKRFGQVCWQNLLPAGCLADMEQAIGAKLLTTALPETTPQAHTAAGVPAYTILRMARRRPRSAMRATASSKRTRGHMYNI